MPAQAVQNKVVIVGGGTAGITVAAQLRRAVKEIDIILIEPSGKHYYQPLWTPVGGGAFHERPQSLMKPQLSLKG